MDYKIDFDIGNKHFFPKTEFESIL